MPNEPVIHWAEEALKPQPQINFIVSGVFSEGSLSVVFGEPGSKKTYSMLDAAVCVALGKSWLNFPTKQVPVLIVDEESGNQRMNKRLGDAMRAHGAGKDLKLAYVVLEGFDLQDTKDQKKLRDLIVNTEAKFVILDALADFLRGDENSVRDVLPGLRALRSIADDTKAAVVLIHHSGKNGRYRGSSSIKGAVDLMLLIQSKPNSPNIDFSCEKARDLEPFSFSAVALFGENTVSLAPSIGKEGGTALTNVEKFIVNYLEKNGDSYTKEITGAAEAEGICKSESARKAINDLVSKNKIERKNEGGPGSKAMYGLMPEGKSAIFQAIEDGG